MASELRRVTVLGATGSVGRRTLDLLSEYPDRFHVTAICAAGTDVEALAAQAARVEAPVVGIADPTKATQLDTLCRQLYRPGARVPDIIVGGGAAAEVAELSTDVVMNAIDGGQGLRPTIAALDAGHQVALANKESLVVGGDLLSSKASTHQLIPVDSEHSAIAQCLRSGSAHEVERLVLTASGGPFRGRTRAELDAVTVADAMDHPTWSMGRINTVNSATLVNKGLEIIEAHRLFGIPLDRVESVLHPEAHVHSMVEFNDGAVIAQASRPDMRLAIACALDWPNRLPRAVPPVDWSKSHAWHFEPVDHHTFPAIALARAAGTAGGCTPAVLNAANEHLVAAFLATRISFLDIVDKLVDTVHTWMHRHHENKPAQHIDELDAAQAWAHRYVEQLLG